MLEDVAIVVRSIGERTEAICLASAHQAVGEDSVSLIRERPFGAAVRRTFQLGIEKEKPWTLAVDADVILRPSAVYELVEVAKRLPESAFIINPEIADKLLGKIRSAGVHLYRTSLFHEALKLANANQIDNRERPETFVREQMAKIGFGAYQLRGVVLGLHAFDQSYRDIYRTAFVHALKHPPHFMQPALSAWERLAEVDSDFRVALVGANKALRTGGKALIDDRLFPDAIEEIDELSGLTEKPPLKFEEFDLNEVCRRLGAFSPFPETVAVNDLSDVPPEVLCQRIDSLTSERDNLRKDLSELATSRVLRLCKMLGKVPLLSAAADVLYDATAFLVKRISSLFKPSSRYQ